MLDRLLSDGFSTLTIVENNEKLLFSSVLKNITGSDQARLHFASAVVRSKLTARAKSTYMKTSHHSPRATILDLYCNKPFTMYDVVLLLSACVARQTFLVCGQDPL